MNRFLPKRSVLINYLFANKLDLLVLIVVGGFVFRIISISKNLSYWNDESHTALMVRYLIDNGNAQTLTGYSSGIYQIFLYYVTYVSYLLLGVSEFSARLPSVMAGTSIIPVIYYVAFKLTKNSKSALLTAFMSAFAQIQLAWSSQLRPYVWLQLLAVLVTYYAYKYIKERDKSANIFALKMFLLSFISVFIHGTGYITVFFACFIYSLRMIRSLNLNHFFILIGVLIFAFILMTNSVKNAVGILLSFDFRIFHYLLFFKEYFWLLIPVLFGLIQVYISDRVSFLILLSHIIIIFSLAIFKINSQYVRYSLTAMPLLFILYSIGLISIYKILSSGKDYRLRILITSIIILVFFGTGVITGKIVVIPKFYYSINNDVRENPIVDYKYAFNRIKTLIEDKSNVIIMDAWNDRVPYYLPNNEFIFLNRYTKVEGEIDPVYGEKMIKEIVTFEKEKKKYDYGVVIVENWESMTPPKLQSHIRSTLKHEFTVNNLPYNEVDQWSISIYSWGL